MLFQFQFMLNVIGWKKMTDKKLKTLKDIKIRKPKGLELPYLDWYGEKLKKEAIKQVILLEMLKLEYGLIRFIKIIKINAQIGWIKRFFNLTKGDLE